MSAGQEQGARVDGTRPVLAAAAAAIVAVVAALLLRPPLQTEAAFTDTSDAQVQVAAATGVPVGAMSQHLAGDAPDGWLLAQGQEVSRADFPELFAVIGTTYGAGDGSTTFNLPDMRGRAPVGLSAGEAEFDELGKAGGAKSHVLTVEEMPSHAHSGSTDSAGRHNHSITVNSGGSHTHSASTGSAGNHRHTGLTVGSTAISWQSNMKGLGDYGSPHGNAKGTDISTGTAGSHTHSVTINCGGAHTHSASSANAGAHTHSVTVDDAGGGQGHNNLQPYTTVNFIVKAK